MKNNLISAKKWTKKQKGWFHGVLLLDILAANMLGNMLAGKPKIPGQGVIRAGE